MKKWEASAPSNIALIKYMGKTDHNKNLPSNVSFSYTVEHLRTFVELEEAGTDNWKPLTADKLKPISLAPAGQERYLNHLKFLKNEFGFNGSFTVKSANNFPAACGIASSASSFAALTLAAAKAIKDLKGGDLDDSADRLNQLSRQGSGSSCRSFFPAWVKWEKDKVETVQLPYEKIYHQVFVAEGAEKKVATSKAHKIVPTSSLFEGRTGRAEKRFEDLISALEKKDWGSAYNTSWAEFWDMHSLFETSNPCFGYMNAATLQILEVLRNTWESKNDGPIVTMDAGPNVHAFYREDQRQLARQIASELSQFIIYGNVEDQ